MKKYVLLIVMFVLVTGCSNDKPVINNLDDLKGKKIGVYMGSEYDQIVEEKIDNAKVMYYNSYNDEISALQSGKIDAFLTDLPLSKEILKNNKDLKILDNNLTEDSYAFAINPKLETLKNDIDKVLINMKVDGTLKRYEDKWFGENEEAKVLDSFNNNNQKTLKFATVSGSAPFAYMKNNIIVGYDIDIINYIGNQLGYNIEIIEMAFEGIIPALTTGKVDIAGCSIIVTEERKKSVLFTEPNYTGGIVVVVRDDTK